VPRTPRIHYQPAGRPACGLPSWLPDDQRTADRALVTCGCCRNTYDWRYAITANTAQAGAVRHCLPGLVVLNPELIIRGYM
jgi:hypothetical protein